MSFRARACSVTAPAAGLAFVLAFVFAFWGAACVSPDTFDRDAGDQPGGQGGGPGAGGSTGTAGSNGAGGHVTTGTGGSTVTGAGGHVVTGAGGTTVTGAGGRSGTAGASGGVLLMDGFETGNVSTRYFWDSDAGSMLNPSSTSCGDWAVVADDGNAANHMFSQREACSGPSWVAGGDSGWIDMRIQAKVKFATGATTSTKIMLGVRFGSDRDQLYIEYTNDGKLKIRQKIAAGGAPSDMSISTKVPVPDDTWVTVALSVSGNTINAYLGDGTTTPTLTATAGTTAMPKGGIGFGTTGGPASFDDILVTAP